MTTDDDTFTLMDCILVISIYQLIILQQNLEINVD